MVVGWLVGWLVGWFDSCRVTAAADGYRFNSETMLTTPPRVVVVVVYFMVYSFLACPCYPKIVMTTDRPTDYKREGGGVIALAFCYIHQKRGNIMLLLLLLHV